MIIDDFICKGCDIAIRDYERSIGDPLPDCPECNQRMEKDWSVCNVGVGNRGQPVNARLCNDGETINRFFAKDDPLCAIEVGLKHDNHSGTRTFTPEQAQFYREKIKKDDSPRLRQEILDVRQKNKSDKDYARKIKHKQLGV
jgi:hypothetical protein